MYIFRVDDVFFFVTRKYIQILARIQIRQWLEKVKCRASKYNIFVKQDWK